MNGFSRSILHGTHHVASLGHVCVLKPMADKSEQLEEFLRVLSALVAFPAPHPLARKSPPQAALF